MPIQLENAGVMHVHIGAHGARCQPDAPLVFRLQPKPKIGIGEGKCLLHLAELEVNSPTRSFHIRKAGAHFRTGFVVGAEETCEARSTSSSRFQWPSERRTRFKLGLSRSSVPISSRPRQSEVTRRKAVTVSARSIGSAP